MSNGTSTTNTSTTTPPKKTAAEKIEEISKEVSGLGVTLDQILGGARSAPGGTAGIVPQLPAASTPPPYNAPSFSTAGAAGTPLQIQPPAAPAPVPQHPMFRTGVEFGTSAGRNAAVAGGAIQGITDLINRFQVKHEEANKRKALNYWQQYQTAVQAGDNQTADLIGSDKKVIGSWKKYLDLEFEKVPEQEPKMPVGPGQTAAMRTSMGPGRIGAPGAPGGIAVPRPTQESQIRAAVNNMVLEGLRKGDPRAMAMAMGPQYVLNPDELRNATRFQYGFELSPAQSAQLTSSSALALTKMQTDFNKYVAGQTIATQRATAVANINGAWRLLGDQERANAVRDAATTRANAIKSITGSKPDKMELQVYKSGMDLYTKLATTYTNAAAKLDAAGHKKEAADMLNEAKIAQQAAKDMQDNYEGTKLLQQLGIGALAEPDEEPPEEP